MADSQNTMLETATSTENLLPVELTIHDHYGRETGAILHRLPTILGRDETADVRLKDPWASHRHCEIDQLGHVLVVRDLNSKNGIIMQGHRVDESHVFPGDQFTIGQTVVTVQYRRGTQSSTSEAREIVFQPPILMRPAHLKQRSFCMGWLRTLTQELRRLILTRVEPSSFWG